LVKNNILLSFNKSSLVWHNDDTYTEFSSAEHTLTLKKNMLKEKFGFEFFLPEDQGYALLVEDLKQ
jgi:hypothetical protein